MIRSNFTRQFFGIAMIGVLGLGSGHAGGKKDSSALRVAKDSRTGQVVVSWSGKGVLKQAGADGRFRPVHTRGASYTVQPTDDQAVFQLDGPVVSVNVVGYVNLSLPPGLSLIANPLYLPTNTVSALWPQAPDGAQVLKYVPETGAYDVSTFDALAGAWSNPDIEIPMGEGFFFRNTASETIVQTFVGEVPQGTLVVHLPAGPSMKGALVPQAGSVNTVHQIPGVDGDVLKLWENDGVGGGDYVSSVFSSAEGGWVPDLQLRVGHGFWIEKQQAQDWVRVFSVN